MKFPSNTAEGVGRLARELDERRRIQVRLPIYPVGRDDWQETTTGRRSCRRAARHPRAVRHLAHLPSGTGVIWLRMPSPTHRHHLRLHPAGLVRQTPQLVEGKRDHDGAERNEGVGVPLDEVCPDRQPHPRPDGRQQQEGEGVVPAPPDQERDQPGRRQPEPPTCPDARRRRSGQSAWARSPGRRQPPRYARPRPAAQNPRCASRDPAGRRAPSPPRCDPAPGGRSLRSRHGRIGRSHRCQAPAHRIAGSRSAGSCGGRK